MDNSSLVVLYFGHHIILDLHSIATIILEYDSEGCIIDGSVCGMC